MNYLDKYKIKFRSLKDGIHEFSFVIDHEFFDYFEKSEVHSGDFKISVTLTKETQLLTFSFTLSGTADVNCDRCLETLSLPVSFTGDLYVHFGTETLERIDEVQVLSEDETEINVAQFIYESINLSLPLKRVHPDDENGNTTCNEQMIKILHAHLPEFHQHDETTIDPRWKELQKLIDNN